ncbi:MAG TPA: exodeoxyribonuclease VII large subunit, partial [Devosia sp.]|nr:exodeoxyribonuclease VII large subunit [Devosia sp.]
EPAGAGALMALLEERRKKLAAEGLFDAQHKQELPYLPRVIGVVTSPSGAVIRDILHRLADRFPTNVIVWPVRVQGETCAPEVAAAVEGFNMLPPEGNIPRPDLIIVARGGGSVEDLWGFNEEAVVRAISESSIPTISAIGHETDSSLADFAADKRAPTPTGAAEMAVPVRSELIAHVDGLGTRGRTSIRRKIARARDGLRASAAGLPRPAEIVGEARQRLDIAQTRLAAALGRARQKKALQLARLAPRLNRRVLLQTISTHRARIGALPLQAAMLRTLGAKRQRLEQNWQLVNSLGYRNVLARGFALVSNAEGQLVRSASVLAAGDRVSLKFADGDKGATITGPDAVVRTSVKKSKKPPPTSDNGQADLF